VRGWLASRSRLICRAALIEHGSHLGFEQGQGLGDVGGTEHGPLEFLELLVKVGVACGAGHGLAEDLEFGLGALEAGGLGVVGCAAGPQAGDGLQGEKQQEAEGGGHGQLGAGAGAVFEQRIVVAELGGDLEQGQAEQGEGGGIDQGARQTQLPGGIEQLQREQGWGHQGSEQHKEHQRHHAQPRGGEEHGSAGAGWFGAGRHGRPQGLERRAGSRAGTPPRGATKKPRRWQGREGN
jgi:hypothetical protein